MADEVLQNREVQESLARDNADNPGRTFGEAVEASDPRVTDLLPATSAHRFSTDEVPEIASTIGEPVATKFERAIDKFMDRHPAALRYVQKALLERRRSPPSRR